MATPTPAATPEVLTKHVSWLHNLLGDLISSGEMELASHGAGMLQALLQRLAKLKGN
jgi:hypothetical protein